MLDVLELDITQAQADFLQSETRGTIFEGGVGAGKTLILCRLAIDNGRNGMRYTIVSYTYRALKDTVYITMEEELKRLGMIEGRDFQINKAEMNFTIGTGVVHLRSADVPNNLRGPNLDGFGMDEPRNFKDDTAFLVMLGRLRNRVGAKWHMSTTTKGKNWVHKLREKKGITWLKQKTIENPFLPQDYIDDLIEKYTKLFARQEMDADIVDFSAGIIRSSWFVPMYHVVPRKAVRFWDLAVSIKTHADYTAGALLSYDSEICLHDMKRFKKKWPDAKKSIIKTAQADGNKVEIAVEQAGQMQGLIDDLKDPVSTPELRGFVIRAVKPKGDKLNRAMRWASKAEDGNFHVCDGPWNQAFNDECDSFTDDDTHDNDDQIDAVSGAVQTLLQPTQIRAGRLAMIG